MSRPYVQHAGAARFNPGGVFCLRRCLRPSHLLAGVCTIEINAGRRIEFDFK